jgi:hypothetical protein
MLDIRFLLFIFIPLILNERSGHQSDRVSELVKGMPKSKEGALDSKFLPRC